MRVLYIDDDPFIREIAEMSLGFDPSFDVRLAENGSDALRLVEDQSWAPELFLIDVMMPGMDGPQLLAALRATGRFTHTPAIFVTARAQPHEHKRLLEAGPIGIITKPFEAATLAADVRRLVEGA
ncbi:response regulator [Phenylobacterium sp.]|jgi:CheY-like chemotaxis protein|uniref:response regulator n=1 Tax=Phenylobacterium sp. TaxID=1871053 RepID=UPI002F93BB41